VPGAPRRLLVVEDDPAMLEVVSEYLRGQDYGVETAPNGRDGLAAVQRQRPDAVLLDLSLPDLDGAEVLRQMVGLDPSLPVIIVTANLDIRLARQLLKDGAFEYIVKPFRLDHLDRMLRAALAKSPPRR
jgi:DNA-binding NtrC family response regulator